MIGDCVIIFGKLVLNIPQYVQVAFYYIIIVLIFSPTLLISHWVISY